MNLIFYNGKIITMEDKDAKEAFANAPEAVWIKDGIIAGTGKLDELEKLAGENAVKRDLRGKCLMPSFIDAHGHVVMNGQMASWADLSECRSFKDIADVLGQYIEENKFTCEDVVMGFGYDHNFLEEGRHPNKRVLDQVSKEIPIFILHISAHFACGNSLLLELAGINENTPALQGGVIGRIENSDEPDGYVEESAVGLLQQAIIPRIKFDFGAMMRNMQQIYAENGVTTVQDGATTENDIKMLAEMNRQGGLKLDIVSYPLMPAGAAVIMEKYAAYCGSYVNRLKIGGYKLVLDGSPQGRSAWMTEPYLGEDPGYCGYPWMEDGMVADYVKQAVAENKQILAHCNGDAASEQFLNAYEKAVNEKKSGKDLRPVMIHCQTVRNDQLERMAGLNMIASIFVGHVWYWGDIHVKNFGDERGNHISPVKDAIDRGVCVNFHQDTPVTKPDMLHSVWCAVNRVSRNGNIIGRDQAVSVYDALKAVTINSAYQYFEEDSKGSIMIGKRADLVILDQSPLEVEPMHIRNIRVLETIKDGETIFSRIQNM